MSEVKHIAVMMGGPSAEREVSLMSGRAVSQALSSLGHQVEIIDPKDRGLHIPEGVDAVFLALHGTYGEDGEVQNALESIGVPYTGSGPESSGLAFDKLASKRIFLKHGLPTPEFVVVNSTHAGLPSELGEKLVLKPICQGSSVGLHFVSNQVEWQRALEDVLKYGDEALVEKCVQGRELTVGIMGGKACPIVEICPKDKAAYDYEHKYTAGATTYTCPAELDAETTQRCQKVALEAFNALGCESYGRVDLLLSQGAPLLLEVNTLPGMTATSLLPMAAAAQGMGFAELCNWMIDDAIRRHIEHSNEKLTTRV
jgi:D-alanine-D-alanine ligase